MIKSTILHDGEDFVLHHHQGGAGYLIVTFVGSCQEGWAREGFLLGRFVEQYEIPCLGITCKTRNLYTSKEMDQVLRAAAPILARYQTVVVIGNSIGGYAAIKFSRRLGATHVLAVTPAFSLDVGELSFKDDAERSMLEGDIPQGIASREMLRGMAIRSGDVSGRIVVVHNPHSVVDTHQMRHLRAEIALEEMPLQHEGHNVFTPLERPETMSKIVDALRFSDSAGLHRAFRTIRRSIPDCVVPILRRGMLKHPVLVDRAMRSEALSVALARYELDQGPISNELAFRLAQDGHETLAFARIERMIQHKLGKTAHLSDRRDPDGTARLQPGRHYLLLSDLGRFLCARMVGSELGLNWNPFSDQDLTPVFASLSGDRLVLHKRLQDGTASAPLDAGGGQSSLDWSVSGGCVLLESAGGLLADRDNDTIRYVPDDRYPSVRFLAIAVDEPNSLIQLRRTGWLEASAQRMAEKPAMAELRTAPSRTRPSLPGWGRLFGLARRAG